MNLNKKIWVASPSFFVMAVAMFIMALISWNFSTMLFVINLVISGISFTIVWIKVGNFKKYLSKTVENVEKSLGESKKGVLERIPIPAVIAGDSDDIVLYNSLFKEVVSDGKECLGESVLHFIPGKTVEGILKQKSTDIEFNKRKYTVFGTGFENSSVFYFIENTKYKYITQEYRDSRPAVAFILFDNREELKRDSTDRQEAQLSSKVESILQNWALETTGFFKKLSDGKYLMVFEERHMRLFEENKFNIIDKIHTVKLDEYRWATISIGIGHGASTLSEAEQWAKNALDMSLGRGGDQVTVKKESSYKFFGGKSKGVEKRSKVRTRVISLALAEQMSSCENVLIMGHRFSDLDSVGAAVGLWNVAVNVSEKMSYVVVNREQSLANTTINTIEKTLKKNIFISPEKAKAMVTDKTLLIIVDTHSQNFLESKELYLSCKNVVVIDHHRMMVEHISNAVMFYHEPFASSSSEMVTELIQYMGDKNLSKIESECLLAGIMLDTKNFFLKTGVRTFEAAAYLKRKGADTVLVKRMFANSIEIYKIKSRLISDVSIIDGCAITETKEEAQDIRVACAQAADELLDVQGVKASFVMFPSEGKISISARSLGEVNVQVIMEAMGGGGHHTMAATQISNMSSEDVREKLINILKSSLSEQKLNKKENTE